MNFAAMIINIPRRIANIVSEIVPRRHRDEKFLSFWNVFCHEPQGFRFFFMQSKGWVVQQPSVYDMAFSTSSGFKILFFLECLR